MRIGPWLLVWLLAVSGCNFPRPADVVDDGGVDAAPAGCARDEDCDAAAPFCLDRTCVACSSSTSCSAQTPVCDAVDHACRNCVKDSECDSGACDLTAGTCVAPSSILYASPSGTPSDPCARLLPCSLDKAATSVDADHPYIVLLPGVHGANAFFRQQKATICGNDATFNTSVARFSLDEGASVEIRDLKMIGDNVPDLPVITNRGSNLTLAGVTIDLSSGGVYAIYGLLSSSTLIRGSRVVHGSITLDGRLVVDESDFLDGGISLYHSERDGSSITNSILVSAEISVRGATDGGIVGSIRLANNTFVGGSTSCGTGAASKSYVSNILFNTEIAEVGSGCRYDFNMFVPAQSLGGDGNITGDPLFVNAAGNDFRLRAGSPAIDAGDPTPLVPNTHDHDGRGRPLGRAPDIGAFEYSP